MAKTQQWQSVKEAAAEIGCTPQRVRQLMVDDRISHTEKYGIKLVAKPTGYRIDKARQRRAKLSRNR